MLVTIREVRDRIALVDTAIGPIQATLDDGAVVTLGRTLQVEFTIDHVVTGDDITWTAQAVGEARIDADGTVITARVESIDGDGVGALRLAPDGLVLIETDGHVEPDMWVTIHIAPQLITVFAIGEALQGSCQPLGGG